MSGSWVFVALVFALVVGPVLVSLMADAPDTERPATDGVPDTKWGTMLPVAFRLPVHSDLIFFNGAASMTSTEVCSMTCDCFSYVKVLAGVVYLGREVRNLGLVHYKVCLLLCLSPRVFVDDSDICVTRCPFSFHYPCSLQGFIHWYPRVFSSV